MNTTTKHALGDRVLVRHVTAPFPRNGKCAVEWLPAELISAEKWYGRERYVALLDDGRRLLAFDEQVRTRPQWSTATVTTVEVEDVAEVAA